MKNKCTSSLTYYDDIDINGLMNTENGGTKSKHEMHEHMYTYIFRYICNFIIFILNTTLMMKKN